MAQLSRQGVNLVYEESGSGDPPLLFVHGWCCDRGYFRPQFEHFAATHRVVAFDQRGHGQSDAPPAGYTIKELADDAIWLCRQLGIERPVAVGHSMGGAVVLEMASRPDPLPRAVAGIDPALFQMNPATLEALLGFGTQLDTEHWNDVLRTFVGSFLFGPGDDPVEKARIIDAMAAAPQRVAVAAWQGLCDWVPADALRSCRVPALIVWADSPVIDMHLPESLCPHLVTEQTVGAGHFNQLFAADQVNEALERFLRSLD